MFLRLGISVVQLLIIVTAISALHLTEIHKQKRRQNSTQRSLPSKTDICKDHRGKRWDANGRKGSKGCLRANSYIID